MTAGLADAAATQAATTTDPGSDALRERYPSPPEGPNTPHADDQPLVDLDVARFYFGEDVGSLRLAMGIFREKLSADLTALSTAVKARNLEQVRYITHQIKAPAAYMGATGLAIACQETSLNAEPPNWDDIDAATTHLASVGEQVGTLLSAETWQAEVAFRAQT